MTIALVALAVAIWLAGGTSARSRPAGHRRAPAPAAPAAMLGFFAAAGIAASAAAFGGPVVGGVVGAVLAPIAAVAGRRAQARAAARPPAAELRWLPLLIDLAAAGLVAGQPLESALAASAPAQLPWLGARLRQVAGRLRLGADPAQAWRPLASEPQLAPLVVTATRSATSGIKLAAGLAELAAELRADARATAAARAQRAGVWVIAPLGLCFLPAFVCLGIVPIVIGIATTLVH